MSLALRCPAKVNLHLEVLGQRPDGFHELRTLFAAVGIWDELRFEPRDGGELELVVAPPGAAPEGEENLVLRAARALRSRLGVTAGAWISLKKAIPAAAGLGGGSADAAAALVGLAALWGCDGTSHELLSVAVELGSDVPFFLHGGLAWGVGRGSEVYPLRDLPPWWVMVLPGEHPVSTGEVYASLSAAGVDRWRPSRVYEWVAEGGELPLLACRNDLEPTVASRWSWVARRLEVVRDTGPLLALLSGSGGAVFGLYESEAQARRVATEVRELDPVVAPVLSRQHSRIAPSAGEGPWISRR